MIKRNARSGRKINKREIFLRKVGAMFTVCGQMSCTLVVTCVDVSIKYIKK